MASSTSSKSPTLVFVAAPAAGHINPLLRVASYLAEKGYDVLFLSSPEYKERITEAGAEWSDLEPLNFAKATPEHIVALRAKMQLEIFAYAFENVFLAGLPKRTQQVRQALEMLHRRDPEKPTILFYEIGSVAVHPFYFGAPLPKGYESMPKTICLGINPLMFDSEVIGFSAPGPGLPFEDSPAVRARNRFILDLVHNYAYKDLAAAHTKLLQEAGCTSWPETFNVEDLSRSDVFLQLCGPSFDYPDPTRNAKIKFVGTLPPKALSTQLSFPSWWPEVTGAAAAGKKVVFLAQGTIPYPPELLLLPTIRALSEETDVLLVVAIGQRGSSLPTEFQIPVNTRVVDYFPYDAVLGHANLFIFNAGYGGAGHAIGNGVPIVVTGHLGEEKAEVAARIEWSGLGRLIRTQNPGTDEIKSIVREVLDNPKYKDTALRLQKESQDLDPFASIEKQVQGFLA